MRPRALLVGSYAFSLSVGIRSAVLEGVVAGLLNADAGQLCLRKRGEDAVDLARKVLGSGHAGLELRQRVEVLVVEPLEQTLAGEGVERTEVESHSGGGINRPAEGDFDDVVVTVAVRVV